MDSNHFFEISYKIFQKIYIVILTEVNLEKNKGKCERNRKGIWMKSKKFKSFQWKLWNEKNLLFSYAILQCKVPSYFKFY